MAKRDAALNRLNKEIAFCEKERCRLQGELESHKITSQESTTGSESMSKRWEQAVARRNVRMQELGLSHSPDIDSSIR